MTSEWAPSRPDLCPACHHSTTHEVRPCQHDRVLFTRHRCPGCDHQWEERSPLLFDLNSTVRGYSGNETADGLVEDTTSDMLKVHGRWLERWQVVLD